MDFLFLLLLFLLIAVFGRTGQILFKQFPSVVPVDMCDQDQKSFIVLTDKLLFASEILCVRAWHVMCFREKQ